MKNGFFVECGGNDGYTQDPTYYLEHVRGWTGIIIEPLPGVAKRCRSNRPKSVVCNEAVVSPSHPSDTITMIDVNLMSVIKNETSNEDEWVRAGEKVQNIKAREIRVPARTLQAIIDTANTENKSIDLLVIDTEGFEYQALSGLDFNKNKPAHILLEAHTEERLNKLTELLTQKGYIFLENIVLKDYLFKYSK